MIMFVPNSRARQWGGNMEEFEGKRRGMLTTGNGATQSTFAICVKGVEWGLGRRGLKIEYSNC